MQEIQQDFSEWRMKARLSVLDCARLFEVNQRTVKNWQSGKTKPPKAVFLYLGIYCGQLDFLGPAWSGFWLDVECIVTPEGEPISAGEIRGAPWAYQALGIKRAFARSGPRAGPGQNDAGNVINIRERASRAIDKVSANDIAEPANSVDSGLDWSGQRPRDENVTFL